MKNETPTMTSEVSDGSTSSYIIGFALSIVLTLIAFYLVERHVLSGHVMFSHEFLYPAITVLAIAQLMIQLVCFLHLGKKSTPRWNMIVLAFATLLVMIVVGGSLWIMSNLNYNMMKMSPSDVNSYMANQE